MYMHYLLELQKWSLTCKQIVKLIHKKNKENMKIPSQKGSNQLQNT